MTSILTGVVASGKTGHLGSPIAGAFDALATVTVGAGGVASVAFNGIPNIYSRLELRWSAQDNRNTVGDGVNLTFNGDSTMANYRGHRLLGYSGGYIAQDFGNSNGTGELSGGDTGGVFGSSICEIPDYANTTKNKVAKIYGGVDNNTNGEVALYSMLWMSTTAINSISIAPSNASTFSQYSTFSLYGVK